MRWCQIVFRQQEGKWPTPRERCFNSPTRAKAVCGGARFRTNFFCLQHDEFLDSLSLSLSLSTEPREGDAVHICSFDLIEITTVFLEKQAKVGD